MQEPTPLLILETKLSLLGHIAPGVIGNLHIQIVQKATDQSAITKIVSKWANFDASVEGNNEVLRRKQ